jgi:hypothetical protein
MVQVPNLALTHTKRITVQKIVPQKMPNFLGSFAPEIAKHKMAIKRTQRDSSSAQL